MRKRTGAVVCPKCGRLVDVNERACPFCGQAAPGMFGYGPALQRLAGRFDVSLVVIVSCVALYVVALFLGWIGPFRSDGREGGMGWIFGWLSPSNRALVGLGMTGRFAMDRGWWWTLLTAIFLHGSLLHLLFNMAITRQFLPNVIELYGGARAWIIFVVAGVVGFVVSNFATGAPTIGASGSIFGLLAAMIVFGWRTHQHAVAQQLWTSAAVMFLFGFLMPGINNWAHAGGFAGGFVAAEAMAFSDRRPGPGVLALSWLMALAAAGAIAVQLARCVQIVLAG